MLSPPYSPRPSSGSSQPRPTAYQAGFTFSDHTPTLRNHRQPDSAPARKAPPNARPRLHPVRQPAAHASQCQSQELRRLGPGYSSMLLSFCTVCKLVSFGTPCRALSGESRSPGRQTVVALSCPKGPFFFLHDLSPFCTGCLTMVPGLGVHGLVCLVTGRCPTLFKPQLDPCRSSDHTFSLHC